MELISLYGLATREKARTIIIGLSNMGCQKQEKEIKYHHKKTTWTRKIWLLGTAAATRDQEKRHFLFCDF
ncbi:hypothetical protein HanRHA438_Chr16g0757931 [Helianthus annuus]|nr:hypothetical protein HanPI659440_Chr16g0636571 [Helianthus annuus]KAJ0835662.1 hypothetical protein HanRHA438_Chr16g0757931 [Helianthus annuus]